MRRRQHARTARATATALLLLGMVAGACGEDGGTAATADPGGGTASTGDGTVEDRPVAGLQLVPLGIDLEEPLDVAVHDDSLFVVERAGIVVELLADGRGGYDAHQVLDVREEVGSTDAEKGLLGVAVSGDGSTLYLDHTRAQDGATVVAAYDLTGEAGERRAGERRELRVIPQPFANHNGGDLAIGPDAMLWVGMGDGGAAGDPEGRAQRLDTPLGKLLRLDPDAEDLVPSDNPYAEEAEGTDPMIWARGLRNPWRISFDADTGDLWVADVGQGAWEEIDVVRAADGTGRGADFGWDRKEGDEDFDEVGPRDGWPDDDAEEVAPVHVYSHDDGRCSVSGGYLYRGSDLAGLRGRYLFSDYCDGVVRALDDTGEATDLGLQADQVVSINPDERGEPLVLHAGGISRIATA